MEEREGWHLDKRVPVALIITLVIYGGAAIYQFAVLSEKVANNTASITAVKGDLNARIDRSNQIQTERFQDISSSLRRIEDKIDRKVDK